MGGRVLDRREQMDGHMSMPKIFDMAVFAERTELIKSSLYSFSQLYLVYRVMVTLQLEMAF